MDTCPQRSDPQRGGRRSSQTSSEGTQQRHPQPTTNATQTTTNQLLFPTSHLHSSTTPHRKKHFKNNPSRKTAAQNRPIHALKPIHETTANSTTTIRIHHHTVKNGTRAAKPPSIQHSSRGVPPMPLMQPPQRNHLPLPHRMPNHSTTTQRAHTTFQTARTKPQGTPLRPKSHTTHPPIHSIHKAVCQPPRGLRTPFLGTRIAAPRYPM